MAVTSKGQHQPFERTGIEPRIGEWNEEGVNENLIGRSISNIHCVRGSVKLLCRLATLQGDAYQVTVAAQIDAHASIPGLQVVLCSPTQVGGARAGPRSGGAADGGGPHRR